MSLASPATVPLTLGGEATEAGAHEVLGGRILFRIPGIGRLLIDSDRVVAAPDDEAGEEALAWIMERHAATMQELLHGRFSLWAAGVLLGGRAVAIAGTDSVGKSTVAAALAQRGHPVLADSALRIELREGLPIAHPDGRRHIELWPEAARSVRIDPEDGEPLRDGLAARSFVFEAAEASPLAAVVILARTADSRQQAEVLSGGAAMEAVSQATQLLGLVDATGARTAHFRWLAAVASNVRVIRMAIDRYSPRPGEVADAVLEAVA